MPPIPSPQLCNAAFACLSGITVRLVVRVEKCWTGGGFHSHSCCSRANKVIRHSETQNVVCSAVAHRGLTRTGKTRTPAASVPPGPLWHWIRAQRVSFVLFRCEELGEVASLSRRIGSSLLRLSSLIFVVFESVAHPGVTWRCCREEVEDFLSDPYGSLFRLIEVHVVDGLDQPRFCSSSATTHGVPRCGGRCGDRVLTARGCSSLACANFWIVVVSVHSFIYD